jgi:hypothetical protein
MICWRKPSGRFSMTDKTWKQIERKVAGYLGGQRVPVSGRQRGDSPDIDHPWLSLEVKHRKTLPGWLADAMDQADKSAQGHQLPLVVLHQQQQRIADSYCVVRLKDFVEWFGDVPDGQLP